MSPTTWPRRRWARSCWLLLGGALLWTLLVCYPNPTVFFRNLARYRRLPLDPNIEREMGWGMPSSPTEIERFLDASLVPTSDWRQYHVPWYVPTPREVATSLHGDCESKTVLFASLLAGRHIPFQIHASFNHVWVDYAGRPERPGERRNLAYLEGKGGRLGLRWPSATDWRTCYEVQKQQLWQDMPPLRRLLWLGGMLWLVLGAFAAGRPRVEADLVSAWRPSRRLYLDALLALVGLQVVMFVFVPVFSRYELTVPWPGLVVEWNVAGLVMMWALSWLIYRFLPRQWLGVSITESEVVGFWSCAGLRRLRRMPRENLRHLELRAPGGDDASWTLSAVRRNGRREPLLQYREELEARQVLRALGRLLALPLVVRAGRVETVIAAEQIGWPLGARTETKAPVPPRPEHSDLVEERSEASWALHYPTTQSGLRWTLLAVALLPAALFGAATWLVGLHGRWFLSWASWILAASLLCTTVYVLLLAKEELVARLANAKVELAEGRFRCYRPDGKVEEVAVEAIESVEFGRVRGLPTVAVVTPTRVLHIRGLFAAHERPWARQAIAEAVVAAQRQHATAAPLTESKAVEAGTVEARLDHGGQWNT